jgi:CheY-like chemotaxis protein
MELVLEGRGYAIRAVSDSRQGREALESQAFDLIVSVSS